MRRPISSTVARIAALERRVVRAGERADHPAAVPSRRAEPDRLLLDDDDTKGRIGAPQLERRPQTGVTGADDADVRVDWPSSGGRSGPGPSCSIQNETATVESSPLT